jgi:hypothetical protein
VDANVTVSVLASVNAADFGNIHRGGVLLSKHANTSPNVFKLCASVTEVTFEKACRKLAPLGPAPCTCVQVLAAAQR